LKGKNTCRNIKETNFSVPPQDQMWLISGMCLTMLVCARTVGRTVRLFTRKFCPWNTPYILFSTADIWSTLRTDTTRHTK